MLRQSHVLPESPRRGAESLFIAANDGTRLHVDLYRNPTRTPTCVLIHGFGDGGYIWTDLCAALRDLCSVAILDLRGHGDSERSRSGRYDLSTYVADVGALVAQLELTEIAVIGHSLGGEIAAHVAANAVMPVLGAILVDTCPEPDTDASAQVMVRLRRRMRVHRTVRDYESLLMNMCPLLSSTNARSLAAGALEACAGGFRPKLDPALLDEESDPGAALSPQIWQELLVAIRCPTLLVRGAASALVSASSAKRMTAALPQGRLVTIERAGHAVPSDNPEALRTSIVDFLKFMLRASHPQ